MTATTYTIFRRTTIGIMDGDRKKTGTEVREELYHLEGGTPRQVCNDLINAFADDDERLDDIPVDDDEYSHLHQMACDDVRGEFSVYAGTLTERPDSEPLYEEGDVDGLMHWEVRRATDVLPEAAVAPA